MKKIYQNPEIIVINVQTSQLMQASPNYGGSTSKTSGNLSRQGSSWDDDEE